MFYVRFFDSEKISKTQYRYLQVAMVTPSHMFGYEKSVEYLIYQTALITPSHMFGYEKSVKYLFYQTVDASLRFEPVHLMRGSRGWGWGVGG